MVREERARAKERERGRKVRQGGPRDEKEGRQSRGFFLLGRVNGMHKQSTCFLLPFLLGM